MASYSAYGLTFSSALPMAGLLASGPEGATTNVEIALAPIANPSSADSTAIRCVSASSSRVHLSWGSVGDLIVEGGHSISVVPAPDVSIDALGLFVAGAGLGVLLHQRGLLVLHGSGVQIGDRAVGFLGGKGWGKSTTAMALGQRGHSVVSDEHLAIRLNDDGQPVVLPGSSPVKLWADALSSLGGALNESIPVRVGLNKYYARPPAASGKSSTLHQLYLLDVGEQLAIECVPPTKAFFGVVPHLYVCRFGTPFLQETGASESFKQLSVLIGKIPVCRLVRPPDLTQLSEMARLIEDHNVR